MFVSWFCCVLPTEMLSDQRPKRFPFFSFHTRLVPVVYICFLLYRGQRSFGSVVLLYLVRGYGVVVCVSRFPYRFCASLRGGATAFTASD